MARRYSNSRNAARSAELSREDRIAEAGEVFTPSHVVEALLERERVREILTDPSASILEPSAGDGAFVVPLVRSRIEALQAAGADWPTSLASLSLIYSVELASDNVAILHSRLRNLMGEKYPNLTRAQVEQVEEMLNHNHLEGDFLARHASILACPPSCEDHEALLFPTRFDLIIGNPPYNPSTVYKAFVKEALDAGGWSAFVLPTTWKLSSAHREFRKEFVKHLVRLDDLPQETFAIKLHTCVVEFSPARTNTFLLNSVVTSALPEEARVANSILAKAYAAWPNLLKDFQVRSGQASLAPYPLHVGWKATISRVKNSGSSLQTLSFTRADPRLPKNVFHFAFPTEKQRRAYVSYSTSKLSAYLQSQADSDMVARHLPIPDLTVRSSGKLASDPYLYRVLGLTSAEIREVESMKLFYSGKAALFYEEENFSLRPDAKVGKTRAPCDACGSSSFHRKGCANSTSREKELRDSTPDLFGSL